MRAISDGAGGARARADRAGPGRRRGWTIAVSALLHVLFLLALLLLSRRPPPQGDMAPSYELMFDGGRNTPSTAPERGDSGPVTPEQPDSEARPPAPAPQPDAVPEPSPAPPPPAPTAVPPASPPEAVLPGPPSPAPTAPPRSDPAPAQPAPQTLPEPRPAPPPAIEAPSGAADAEVRLAPPPPPAPAPPMVPDLVMPPPPPLPVPPQPVPPQPARPPAPRPRTAPPPAAPPGSFANPMDLSFNQAPRNQRQAAPRTGAAPGSVASRSMDLSTGAPKAGPNRSEAFFDARARALGADWMQGVQAFWLRHRYYPRQAAENGEDGDVDLELTVDRTGRVQSAVVKQRSGSAFIDMAAVGTFRGAQLPPLPEEVEAPFKTTITIHYMLIR